MIWPPQDTGLFAVPECIACCVTEEPCINSFEDNPFDIAHWTIRDTTPGCVITTVDMGTFQRLTFTLADGTFTEKDFIFTGFAFDAGGPCGVPAKNNRSMRARVVSATTSSSTFTFIPIVTQAGKYYAVGFSARFWTFSSVGGPFQTRSSFCDWNAGDAWNEYYPTPSGSSPDFTASAPPTQMGFRLLGPTNFSGSPKTIVLDVEFFTGNFL